MIYEELRNLISLTRADNTVDTFDSAIRLFETMGQDDYMDIFSATINSSPNLTEEELILELINDLTLLINNIFSIQGVVLAEEVILSDKVKLAKGLIDIFDYSDRPTLVRIVETDLNPEEQLSELLGLVTEYNVETIFSFIQEVNPGLPQRLKDTILEEAIDQIYSEVMKSIITLYLSFKEKLMENRPFYTDKHVSEISTIGRQYSFYLDDLLKNKDFVDLLSKLDNVGKIGGDDIFEEVSKYLIGIACLSEDGFTNILEVIRSNMDKITSNMTTNSKLQTYISKYLIKLTSTGAVNE
jgi:hypothetical protein